MAEVIIQLAQFRRSVRTPGGVSFPTVHRVSGCSWHLPEGDAPMTPDPSWPYREYSLSPDATGSMANETVEPIARLDPIIDRGWVIVRYHQNYDLAHAYLDGIYDGEQDYKVGRCLWQTEEGIFTLHHRVARRGCRDGLLIYAVSADWPPLASAWCHIVASDGSTFSDEDILLPDLVA